MVFGLQVEERILKLMLLILLVVVLEMVSFYGRLVICGMLYRVLLLLMVMLLIEVQELLVVVLFLKVMLQVIGRLSDVGEFMLMVLGVVKVELIGVMVVVLVMDEMFRQRVRVVKDGRDLMDFIVLYFFSELVMFVVVEF